jgi:hypothetical protein
MSIVLLALTAHSAIWSENPPVAFDLNAEIAVTIEDALASFSSLNKESCTTNDTVMGPADIDLVDAPTVYGPSRTCGVTLEHAGTLTLHGTGLGGAAGFTVALGLGDLSFDCGAGISGGADMASADRFVVEVLPPGWAKAEELGLLAGSHVSIDAKHPLHDTFVARVLAGANVYADLNGDGRVDSIERENGAVCTRVAH